MLHGFNLVVDESDAAFLRMCDTATSPTESHREQIQKQLDDYLLADNSLSAKAMSNDWFSPVKADIFISHSHQDEALALSLSKWIHENFSLTSFIDSSTWGYADNLLKQIDDKHCLDDDRKHYIYERRNISTAHVHMMLSSALVKMIDHCEAVFFLNTPNSIKTSQEIQGSEGSHTNSAWLFHELSTMQTLRRNSARRNRRLVEAAERVNKGLNWISHPAPLEDLEEVNTFDLLTWSNRYRNDNYKDPLDVLYEIKGLSVYHG